MLACALHCGGCFHTIPVPSCTLGTINLTMGVHLDAFVMDLRKLALVFSENFVRIRAVFLGHGHQRLELMDVRHARPRDTGVNLNSWIPWC